MPSTVDQFRALRTLDCVTRYQNPEEFEFHSDIELAVNQTMAIRESDWIETNPEKGLSTLRAERFSALTPADLKVLAKARRFERGGFCATLLKIIDYFLAAITFGCHKTVDEKLDRVIEHALASNVTLNNEKYYFFITDTEKVAFERGCQKAKHYVQRQFTKQYIRHDIDLIGSIKAQFKRMCLFDTREQALDHVTTGSQTTALERQVKISKQLAKLPPADTTFDEGENRAMECADSLGLRHRVEFQAFYDQKMSQLTKNVIFHSDLRRPGSMWVNSRLAVYLKMQQCAENNVPIEHHLKHLEFLLSSKTYPKITPHQRQMWKAHVMDPLKEDFDLTKLTPKRMRQLIRLIDAFQIQYAKGNRYAFPPENSYRTDRSGDADRTLEEIHRLELTSKLNVDFPRARRI